MYKELVMAILVLFLVVFLADVFIIAFLRGCRTLPQTNTDTLSGYADDSAISATVFSDTPRKY